MTEQDDDDYAAQVEMARLLHKYIRKRQREASGLPRYKGRARVRNKITLYLKANGTAEFRFSYDTVCAMRAWVMHEMVPRDLLPSDIEGLRLDVVNFRRKSMPMFLLRLTEWAPKPYGYKLRRLPKSWTFSATMKAAPIGIDPTARSLGRLEIVPYPAVKGYLVILPDSHRLYKARRDDVQPYLDGIDPEEPPRFRHNTPDPAYVAKLAAEAAERTDQ